MKNITESMGKHIHRALQAVATVALIGVAIACNDEMEHIERGEYPQPGEVEIAQNKVLWVIMDGAGGAAVKQARNSGTKYVPNIRAMLQNAVYTFDGVADSHTDAVVTKEIGWANLMTGTTQNGLQNGGGLSALAVPTIIQRFKADNPSGQVAVMAADKAFQTAFASDADITFTGNDASIQEHALQLLSGKEVPELTILEFSGARLAGETHGFYDENGLYATDELLRAISQLDNHMGNLQKAIESRSIYQREKWLLMVTSGFGGSEDNAGETVYDKRDRNTFGMIYNSKFSTQLLQRPTDNELDYKYYSPLFADDVANAPYAQVNDPSLFNIIFDKEEEDPARIPSYTVQFFYKQLKKGQESQHTLVSKALKASPSSGEGWTIRNDYFRPKVIGDNNTWWGQEGSTRINDGNWHVITVAFDYPKLELRIYIDGTLVNNGGKAVKIDRDLNVQERASLTIGKITGSSGRNCGGYYLTNLQFYDIALPDEFVKSNYKLASLDKLAETYPYWGNLIGYWPADREEDFATNVLYDYSRYGSIYGGENAGKSDMTIYNEPQWVSGNDHDENIQTVPDDTYYQFVLNNVDFASQTLQWLGISIDTSWGWEGIARDLPYQSLETTN